MIFQIFSVGQEFQLVSHPRTNQHQACGQRLPQSCADDPGEHMEPLLIGSGVKKKGLFGTMI